MWNRLQRLLLACVLQAITCPTFAVMRVVNARYGSPQSIVYMDSEGRTVRTATQLIDGSFSVADADYNARGLLQRQYEPARNAANQSASTLYTYDALSRPLSKIQLYARADQDSLTGGFNSRRTFYSYSGLSTTIKVCQAITFGGQSSIRAGNLGAINADGSPQLLMSRSFDSAGKLIKTVDAAQNTTRYWFDGAGNPLRITDVMNLSINASYNDFGHREAVSDPSRGNWSFTYNGFGEVKTQTDARGLVTTIGYDNLGRAISRTWAEPDRFGRGISDFAEINTYENSSSSAYGTLKSTARSNGSAGTVRFESWARGYGYDALNRSIASSTRTQVGTGAEVLLTTQSYFDRNFGRVKQQVFPRSQIDSQPLSTYQAYNVLGVPIRSGFVADYVAAAPETSVAYHEVTGTDGRGLIVGESFGVAANSVDWRATSVFDSSGWLLAQCVSNSGSTCSEGVPTGISNQPLDQRYRFDIYGNLKTQWHAGAWAAGSGTARGKETYQYDALHRLTLASRSTANNSVANVEYGYNAIGGLLKKTDYSANSPSAYSYVANSHRVNQVALSSGNVATYGFDPNGNVTERNEAGSVTTLRYDIANLPQRMTRGFNTADFYEGPSGRFLQYMVSNGTQRETYHLDKRYERELVNGVASVERYYLSSGVMLLIKPNVGRKLNYLHNDRLGSPVAISEKPLPNDGRLGSAIPVQVEHKGFDAFGKALDGQWGTSNQGMLNLSPIAFTNFGINQGQRNQRGFTGHEHLDEFALIHMNGRAYDYNLGRFYGVDPIVQFPSNSQSLNPYAYLMNNPLSGTDPTGYFVFLAPAVPYAVAAVEAVGAALAVYGAAETGAAIGTAVVDISSGNMSAGDAASAVGVRAAEAAVDRYGGRILNAVVPDSVKQIAADTAGAMAKKLGLGDNTPGNGADKNVGGNGTDRPNEIGDASGRRVVTPGEQDQMAVEAADSAASILKSEGAKTGAVTARVSVGSDGKVTTTAVPSQGAAASANQTRGNAEGTGCRPTCGEGPNINQGRSNGEDMRGSSMATVQIDGRRIEQPDGSYKLAPGKKDGELKPACDQGCSDALNREEIRDAVRNCEPGDKNCAL